MICIFFFFDVLNFVLFCFVFLVSTFDLFSFIFWLEDYSFFEINSDILNDYNLTLHCISFL